MKANQLIISAVSAFNAETTASVNRFNAWIEAWNGLHETMQGFEFIAAMLAQFDKAPLAAVRDGATDEMVKNAHARRRKVLYVQLMRDMPKIDPTAEWSKNPNKANKKSDFQKAGVDDALLAAVAKSIAKTPGITAPQIAAILAKLGVKA